MVHSRRTLLKVGPLVALASLVGFKEVEAVAGQHPLEETSFFTPWIDENGTRFSCEHYREESYAQNSFIFTAEPHWSPQQKSRDAIHRIVTYTDDVTYHLGPENVIDDVRSRFQTFVSAFYQVEGLTEEEASAIIVPSLARYGRGFLIG